MKPIYIALLEHGELMALEGTTFPEVLDWAQEHDYLPHEEHYKYTEMMGLLRDLFFECFKQNTFAASSVNHWGLKVEYYYRLLDYRELHEARENSRKAQRNALLAICISIFALIASISIGYIQLNKPIEISQQQISKIISEVKLNSQQKKSNDDKNTGLILEELKLRKEMKSERTDSKPEISNNKN